MEPEEPNSFLEDVWSMYFHDPYNVDWTYDSYIRICEISSMSTYIDLLSHIGNKISQGMFFLFRESVFPCWDDPSNINGGSFSFKVANNRSPEFWKRLTSSMLNEQLECVKDEGNFDMITGMSISPKKNFCIVKIWVKDAQAFNKVSKLNIDPKYVGEVLFKPHRETIAQNNAIK